MKPKIITTLLFSTGILLVGCNSGGSYHQSLAPAQSYGTQNYGTQDAVIAEGTEGFVITKDGNLDYYKNDHFVGKKWKFEDGATAIDMVSNRQGGWNVYVVSGKSLKKCTGTDEWSCTTIDNTLRFSAGAVKMNADGNGYALISSGDNDNSINLVRYVNDHQAEIKKIIIPRSAGIISGVDRTSLEWYGDDLYFILHNKLFKYNLTNNQVATLNDINVDWMSVDHWLYGYGINRDSKTLSRIMLGKNELVLHTFNDSPKAISATDDAVYVTTSKWDSYNLYKCSVNGDSCSNIDTFASAPFLVVFRSVYSPL